MKANPKLEKYLQDLKEVFQLILHKDILLWVTIVALMFFVHILGYSRGMVDGYTHGNVNAITYKYESPDNITISHSLWDEGKLFVEYVNKGIVNSFPPSANESIFPVDNIVYECKKTSKLHNSVYAGLSRIPDSVLNEFVEREWTIFIKDELTTIDYRGSDLDPAGVTSVSRKEIQLEADIINIPEVLAHEMGHAFDYFVGGPSYGADWFALYENEWSGLYSLSHSFHSVNGPTEFFAESFSYYILEPEKFQQSCPETYTALTELFTAL